jgi:RNA polymerase sigma-70 factor (ECF subfamily)
MAPQDTAWRDLLHRHGPVLLLYARQIAVRQADAEDALQEGFIRFWHHREEAKDPLAFLFACVRSAAMDARRSNLRRQKRELSAAEEESFVCPRSAEEVEQQQLIIQAMAELPLEQREVLVKKLWGGLTFQQIAAAREISPNTAAAQYRYALLKLKHHPALRREANCE